MEEKRKKAWSDAYHEAFGLTRRQGLDTVVLTIGMMWLEVLENTAEKIFQKSTREP